MPTYEYQCDDCGHVFERVEHISAHKDRAPACPKCKGSRTHQVTSGFYAKTVRKS